MIVCLFLGFFIYSARYSLSYRFDFTLIDDLRFNHLTTQGGDIHDEIFIIKPCGTAERDGA